jgi:hypothetical protein
LPQLKSYVCIYKSSEGANHSAQAAAGAGGLVICTKEQFF